MALMVERLLAARFCNAIERFIRTECFLSLNIKLDARMAAGQFEASATRPTSKSVSEVSLKGYVQIMRWLMFRHAFDWNDVLNAASYAGHLRFVYLAMKEGSLWWLNVGLYQSCRGGHRKVAEFMISKGAHDWDAGLRGACKGGHHELATLMISKGANEFNRGLRAARKCGHRELAVLMIANGANDFFHRRLRLELAKYATCTS
jgi:hypothetical protein